MLIYNETLLAFKSRLEKLTKDILRNECQLKVGRSRFSCAGYTYPLKTVIFEHPRHLGYFEPGNYTLAFNKNLITIESHRIIKNIIRHELAHYLCAIEYQEDDALHGRNFKIICQKYNWNTEVSAAKMDLEFEVLNSVQDARTQALMNKVKKLFKLGSSDNSHESHLATNKANELLLKYNLSLVDNTHKDTDYYQKSVLTQKKRNAKIEALYDIISQFMVKPVLSYTKKGVSLDLFGTKVNIEFAEYVIGFLDFHLEALWLSAKEEHNYKGIRQKNSFFKGIAQGFINKPMLETDDYQLVVQEIENRFRFFVKGHSSAGSQAQTDHRVKKMGIKAGESLHINPAVKNKNSILYLE